MKSIIGYSISTFLATTILSLTLQSPVIDAQSNPNNKIPNLTIIKYAGFPGNCQGTQVTELATDVYTVPCDPDEW